MRKLLDKITHSLAVIKLAVTSFYGFGAIWIIGTEELLSNNQTIIPNLLTPSLLIVWFLFFLISMIAINGGKIKRDHNGTIKVDMSEKDLRGKHSVEYRTKQLAKSELDS